MSSVSVILPLYNCEPFVAAAVESVLRQDHTPLELIVVDDGSTDASVQRLAPYLSRLRLITQRNSGVAAARNAGVQAARGDYIAFIDSDDVWTPSKLSLQLATFGSFRGSGAVFSDFSVIDEQGGILLPSGGIHWKYGAARRLAAGWSEVFQQGRNMTASTGATVNRPIRIYEGSILGHLFGGNMINTSSIMLRRVLVESIGVFDAALKTEEDYDYWLRASARWKFAYVDAPLVAFRTRAGQLTSQDQLETILRNVDTVIRRLSPSVEPVIGKGRVRKRIAAIDRDLGEVCLRAGLKAESRRRLLDSVISDPARISTHALLALSLLPPSVYDAIFGAVRRIRQMR